MMAAKCRFGSEATNSAHPRHVGLSPDTDPNSDSPGGLSVAGNDVQARTSHRAALLQRMPKGFNLFRSIAAGPTISIRQWVTPWDDWISSAISTAAK